MRINWLVLADIGPTLYDIDSACLAYFEKYKTSPDTIILSRKHYSNLLSILPRQIIHIPPDVEYITCIPLITGGAAQIIMSDDESDTRQATSSVNYSLMVLENKKLEKAFEKHMLGVEND